MKRLIMPLVFAALAGCAGQPGSGADEAVSDFVAVSGLEEMDSIKTRKRFGTSELTKRYAILRTGKDVYLVEFAHCPPRFDNNDVTPDIRYDTNVLRSRFDTIRGCRIKKIFAIDEAGAEELKMLVESPGTERS